MENTDVRFTTRLSKDTHKKLTDLMEFGKLKTINDTIESLITSQHEVMKEVKAMHIEQLHRKLIQMGFVRTGNYEKIR